MAIQTLHDTGNTYNIPAKYDGGVYQVAVNDCVLTGMGDEFTLNYTSSSLNVTFYAGSQAVIGGAFFHVTSSETVTLSANSTIYLCANIDLSRPNGQTGSFVARTSSDIRKENLNGSGTTRDLLLYVITTGAAGVTSVQDKRVIRSKPSVDWRDIENQPAIPTVNDATLTIQVNGVTQGTFSANAGANKTINITVPSVMYSINPAQHITTVAGGTTYTATQDCFACFQNDGTGFVHYIDGVQMNYVNAVFIKKGQTVNYPNTHNASRILIYGVK